MLVAVLLVLTYNGFDYVMYLTELKITVVFKLIVAPYLSRMGILKRERFHMLIYHNSCEVTEVKIQLPNSGDTYSLLRTRTSSPNLWKCDSRGDLLAFSQF